MSKRIFTLLTLGVAAVAVAGFSMPAEGGLFGFFRHARHHGAYYSDCGYVDAYSCPPSCGRAPYRAYSPPPPSRGFCAYPPPTYCGYDACGHDFDDDDDSCDWDDDD